MQQKKRIVVGVSGASGIPVAVEILRGIRMSGAESHLVFSQSAKTVMAAETDFDPGHLLALSDTSYDNEDLGAAIASGSYRTEGMIIAPCSMKTVAGIASGYSDNLLLRAADVMLKERRRLVLVIRECPLSGIHLRNLTELARMGADILPMVLTFYNNPQSIDDMVRHIAGKALDPFGIDLAGYRRWKS